MVRERILARPTGVPIPRKETSRVNQRREFFREYRRGLFSVTELSVPVSVGVNATSNVSP